MDQQRREKNIEVSSLSLPPLSLKTYSTATECCCLQQLALDQTRPVLLLNGSSSLLRAAMGMHLEQADAENNSDSKQDNVSTVYFIIFYGIIFPQV